MTAPLQRDPLGESLFEASEDCVKLVSLDGALQGMNVNGRCLMEIDDFETVRGLPWGSLWPEPERAKIEAAIVHARSGQVARFSADCPTAKGTLKSWDVLVSPVVDDGGQVVRLVSISRDVTEVVRVNAENTLLARELAHRIRNMFAVVDGVISLSARAADAAARPFAAALRERLIGLGRALAYVSPQGIGDAPDHAHETLHGLLHALLSPYDNQGEGGGRVEVSGDDVRIGRSATTSVALLVHELATNALKYGALGVPDGRVTLVTRRTEAGVELLWTEHGAPGGQPASTREDGGFGTTLMDNAVRRQLGGELQREWGPDGLLVRVTLPPQRFGG